MELRIVVAGPPKAGNVWVDRLLAAAYDLRVLADPPGGGGADVLRFHAAGRFPAGSIFHQHFWAEDELIGAIGSIGARIVTIQRDPYDTFVSLYHYVQRFPDGYIRNAEPAAAMIGRPVDHPDVLSFLEEGYGRNLANAVGWAERRDATIELRYERLQADTALELRRATDALHPVSDAVLRAAVRAAAADAVRRIDPSLAVHVRVARTGDWRNHLGPRHVDIFRRKHADAVRRLGYPVR